MSDPTQTVVIVGGGQAGGEIAIELRKRQFPGRVLILSEEPHLPYKRPPLSKAYLAGSASLESLSVVPAASLEKAGIEFRGNARVVKLDRVAKRLTLADGERLDYFKLALATGGRARPLPVAGADRPNVFLLRTIADVQAIRARCAPGKRVCIVGGGFIGLEVAAVLCKAGLKVTVLEGLPRVLARVTVPEVSAFYERVHRDAGVDLRTGAQLAGFEGTPEVTHAVLADGHRIDTDLVVVGIGLIPNTALAEQAALAVDNGIVVDDCARTSDPDIVAAGDCTSHPNARYGRSIRLESVQNAMEQGRAAAATLAGSPAPYRSVPWFWSDQYDLKLQMVGLSAGFERLVIRGDPAKGRAFAVLYFRGDELLAADTVNRPQDFMFAKKLVAERIPVDPEKVADESVSLKTFLPS